MTSQETQSPAWSESGRMKLADFWLPYAKIRAKVANLATLHVYRDLRERCYGAHVIIIR